MVKGTREAGIRPLGVEGYNHGNWVLVDYGDVVLHIFEQNMRDFYDLESLWEDCERVDWRTAPAPLSGSPE